MTLDLVTATHETFAPLVGAKFTVAGENGPIVLTLDNVKLFSEATQRDNHLEIDGVVFPSRRAFSLTFEGPREPVLAHGMHRLENAEHGPLEVFIKPFRQDHDCTLYESSFS